MKSGDTTASAAPVGAGVEQHFTPNWSVKAEYQYIDLGSNQQQLSGVSTNGVFLISTPIHTTTRFNTVRVGLNYSFGSGAVVAKY